MEVKEIIERIRAYKAEGKRMFVSSSFQTHSIALLHIISEIDDSIPVVFLNTGFLFPQTIAFKGKVATRLGLHIIPLRSAVPRSQQIDPNGRFYFTSDPDRCCYINKVLPMERMLMKYDVWINGIRRDQSDHRNRLSEEEPAGFDCMRFHPMLDWSAKKVYDYLNEHELPRHPLDDQGYISIGCEPCTRKFDPENAREGRWFGMSKTECGLHTELIKK